MLGPRIVCKFAEKNVRFLNISENTKDIFKYLKIPESNYFWQICQTNKSTGNLIANQFSYNSNAIWVKKRL